MEGCLSGVGRICQSAPSCNDNTMRRKVLVQLQDNLSSGLALETPGSRPEGPPSSGPALPPGCRSGRGGQGVGDSHHTLQRLPRQKHRTSAQLRDHFNHGSPGAGPRRKQRESEVSTPAGRGSAWGLSGAEAQRDPRSAPGVRGARRGAGAGGAGSAGWGRPARLGLGRASFWVPGSRPSRCWPGPHALNPPPGLCPHSLGAPRPLRVPTPGIRPGGDRGSRPTATSPVRPAGPARRSAAPQQRRDFPSAPPPAEPLPAGSAGPAGPEGTRVPPPGSPSHGLAPGRGRCPGHRPAGPGA